MIIAVACQVPLGMEDGRIADSQITASNEYNNSTPTRKTYHGANNARLNRRAQSVGNVYTTGAWCAGKSDVNQWIQVEFTIPTWVTGSPDSGETSATPPSVGNKNIKLITAVIRKTGYLCRITIIRTQL